jgi:DNA recombination protein RmuC
MTYVLVLVIVGAGLGGLGLGWYLTQAASAAAGAHRRAELEAVIGQSVDLVRRERGESLQAALSTVLSVASSKLEDQLEAGREVVDRDRELVVNQVQVVHSELARVAALVRELQKERAQQTGQLTSGLEHAVQVTTTLAATTQSLQRALASPKARGQWGERMAEDVLRSAGFVDGVNYTKQTRLTTGRVPDYTFPLPRGHVVHMDVKFPIDNYLRWLEADSDLVRSQHLRQFQRDVRIRIKELAVRSYVDPETTVDYLLLFVPNESVYGFIHEHDGTLIDEAIAAKVVLCSPTTLFAVLAVIRQAVDNFLVERRSDEILGALSGLRDQWDRWSEPIEKMRRGLSSAQKAFDELAGPRYRQFSRQLEKLEAVRDNRIASAEDPWDAEHEDGVVGHDGPGGSDAGDLLTASHGSGLAGGLVATTGAGSGSDSGAVRSDADDSPAAAADDVPAGARRPPGGRLAALRQVV